MSLSAEGLPGKEGQERQSNLLIHMLMTDLQANTLKVGESLLNGFPRIYLVCPALCVVNKPGIHVFMRHGSLENVSYVIIKV